MSFKRDLALVGLTALLAGAGYLGYQRTNSALEERAHYQDLATRRDLKPGMDAPDFTLKSVDGREISLSKLEDKIVILDFWATWCGPCQAVTPRLESMYKEFKDKGLEVIQIAIKDKEGDIKKYLETHKSIFPLVHDKDNKLRHDYNIEFIPMLFRIEKGKVVSISYGFVPEWIENIKKELKNK